MPIFEYRGKNAAGENVNGTLFCASMPAAVDDLTRRGYVVEHLQVAENPGDPVPSGAPPIQAPAPAPSAVPSAGTAGGSAALYEASPSLYGPTAPAGASPGAGSREFSASERQMLQPAGAAGYHPPRSRLVTDVMGPIFAVPLPTLLFFFRQLSTMLNAGVAPVQSLDTLASQTADPRMVGAIRELRQHALEGRPLTYGLERYPEIFSPLMISLVRAGEETGRVDESLKMVARHIEQEISIRNLYRKVTFYPKLVVIASIFIILGANGVIAALGKEGGIWSPLTQVSTWIVLGPLLVFGFLFFRVGVKQNSVRKVYDEVLQKAPGLGKILHQFAMAKFGRAFGTLYAGGVATPRATMLSADACGNEFLRRRIYPCAREIEEGGSIADAFARTGAFSPIVLDMVRTGETTGNLDSMLNNMADFYEDEAHTKAMQLGTIFGVVCLLLVAIYVLIILIQFYGGYGAQYQGLM